MPAWMFWIIVIANFLAFLLTYLIDPKFLSSSTTVVDRMLTWFHTLSGGRNHGAVAGAGARPRRRDP